MQDNCNEQDVLTNQGEDRQIYHWQAQQTSTVSAHLQCCCKHLTDCIPTRPEDNYLVGQCSSEGCRRYMLLAKPSRWQVSWICPDKMARACQCCSAAVVVRPASAPAPSPAAATLLRACRSCSTVTCPAASACASVRAPAAHLDQAHRLRPQLVIERHVPTCTSP